MLPGSSPCSLYNCHFYPTPSLTRAACKSILSHSPPLQARPSLPSTPMEHIRFLWPFFLLLKLAGAFQLGQQNGSGNPLPQGWPGELLHGPGGEGSFRAGCILGERLFLPSQEAVSQAAGTRLPEGGAEEQVPPVENSPLCPSKGGFWLGCGSRVVKSSLVCALGILIMLGNGTVITVIASSVSGWSHSSRLVLLSLAAADAALAVLVVPLSLYHSLVLRPGVEEGLGGASSCRAVAFINSSVFGASLYSLAGVSLERYVAVFFPLHYGRLLTCKRVALFIVAAWLLPALLLVPLTVPGPRAVLQVRFSAAALLCEPDYASNPSYSLMLAGTIFCPAAGTITFANLRLWLVARSQQQRGRSLAFRRRGAGPKRLRLLNVGPASRILGPVVLAFYICWAPCMGTILYNAITQERVHEWLEFVAMWLPTSSGFLNCFVYFWINRSFRHKFQRLGRQLSQLCCGSKQAGLGLLSISVVVQRGCEQPGLSPDDSSSISSSLILSQKAQAAL